MLMLAIYGSPRKGGNTDLMLDAFLEGAGSASVPIERIYVRNLAIAGCLGCGYCDKKGVCTQKDDMAQVYPLMDRATHVVVASPVYFYSVTGQLKLLIDRAQAPFMQRELAKKDGKDLILRSGKKGFLLSAGATRGKRLFDCTMLTVRYFFDALGAEYAGELCFRELDERGAIRTNAEALEACRQAGKAFVIGAP